MMFYGIDIQGPITRKTLVDLIEAFQHGQVSDRFVVNCSIDGTVLSEVLHERYVCEILHQARAILKSLPNFNHIDLSSLHHIFIIGDLHGQLADLLHIFNSVGSLVVLSFDMKNSSLEWTTCDGQRLHIQW